MELICSRLRNHVDHTADVATVLGRCWAPVCAAELVTTGALVVRGAALVALPWYEAIATVLTLAVAPPLAVVACISAYTETDHGGASTVVLVPAAIAAGSTAVTWVRGRPLAFAAALRAPSGCWVGTHTSHAPFSILAVQFMGSSVA